MKFIGCDCDYQAADIVVFGAPFDGTASNRPGSRYAPGAMRQESEAIETYSPYVDKDICDLRICDDGDLELPFGNLANVVDIIEECAAKVLSGGKLPVMLGGEHLVTLGAAKAVFAKHPDLCMIHFDAHTDLRDDYLGEKLSHATVIRRCWDFLGNDKIYQFGIRSGLREEFEWAKKHTTLQKFDFGGLDEVISKLGDKPVYLTIDLDVVDPSEFCGTGTPEAGGVSFTALREAIEKMGKLNIVAADLVELAPQLDASGASTALACKVLRELLLSVGSESNA
ncbi:MAG: agmatinase [Oscillospiraceae bacterium]|nr:agmatinase [Oscillospiraceae bacterium]